MRRGKIYALHCGRRALVDVVPDSHTGLYRISWPDIGLSDVTNMMRAKAAALEWAEQKVVTEGRKMPVAQRLKSLGNFWWSSSYVAQNVLQASRGPKRQTRTYGLANGRAA